MGILVERGKIWSLCHLEIAKMPTGKEKESMIMPGLLWVEEEERGILRLQL